MAIWSELEPKNVFLYFEEISAIPHGSGNTDKISDYLVNFAKEHHLEWRQEPCGNVIIKKPASPDCKSTETVMLQGHMDMVAVKEPDCDLDMAHEGLRLAITDDGAWVYARGTSLGGDDGIALAYALAILADDTLTHPALEAVFTVDEEIGLLGAAALDASDLKSRILLNMDSEDDGIFLTGCAGGATMECLLPAPMKKKSGIVYQWKLTGLQGGHSGSDIHLERANANLLFGRFLLQTGAKADFALGSFSGGEKDNAIAHTCEAVFVTAPETADAFEEAASEFADVIRAEYAITEPGLSLTLTKLSASEADVLTDDALRALKTLLVHLPSGILRHMPSQPDMVQTSLNLGVLCLKNGEVSLTYSVRSASRTEKERLLMQMEDLTGLAGGHWNVSGVYPAWEYLPDSKIQCVMAETYEELTGEKPVLTGIHAGVECGILSEKLPGIDCISYGPQMHDIHTTRERLNIASVKKNYELTVRVLEKLAAFSFNHVGK